MLESGSLKAYLRHVTVRAAVSRVVYFHWVCSMRVRIMNVRSVVGVQTVLKMDGCGGAGECAVSRGLVDLFHVWRSLGLGRLDKSWFGGYNVSVIWWAGMSGGSIRVEKEGMSEESLLSRLGSQVDQCLI